MTAKLSEVDEIFVSLTIAVIVFAIATFMSGGPGSRTADKAAPISIADIGRSLLTGSDPSLAGFAFVCKDLIDLTVTVVVFAITDLFGAGVALWVFVVTITESSSTMRRWRVTIAVLIHTKAGLNRKLVVGFVGLFQFVGRVKPEMNVT